MRTIFFIILFSTIAQASALHRMAMVKDGAIANISVWDDVSPWNPPGYALVDITASSPMPGIGWTCSVCDGSDFVAPQAQE